ncbi:hypothetical protein ACQP06_10175 [Nocardia sp. CA-136227]|uniref:hypothetical protein n=1 Tax=Nocardia sp. CA-136227 TaxID=3239979 RepID=UPI003D9765C7
MNGFPREIAQAVIGIAVPIMAFVWEFVLVGRAELEGGRVSETRSRIGASPKPLALRFLTGGTGKGMLRSRGNTPCGELPNPTTCSPQERPRGPVAFVSEATGPQVSADQPLNGYLLSKS